MDPYEEERAALEKAAFAAELRMAMEEGVERGWLFVEERENGESPNFVAVDAHGSVFTTEAALGRIQKFTEDGKVLFGFGDNSIGPGGFGGRPKNLPGPIAVCVDKQGRIWVSATNNRVQQFSAEGKFLSGFGQEGKELSEFKTPHGLAIDSKGDLYVVDAQNQRIQKFAVND